MREAGASDLGRFRVVRRERSKAGLHDLPALARLVVVIDEFATLATSQPAFLGALLGVAQRGRSLGVHLVLATQRPSGVVSDDISANTNLRIALRLQDRAESNDVVGDAAAAHLPRSIPGRA
ncbi:MAG TPA: FtsK/SpoIIIE domain-containing protein, partial [Ilumatobacteraceae bacterium]|nr:FtsK/SpoIIIE domain-containing protein [Ilumatobacteraceae bacterium]